MTIRRRRRKRTKTTTRRTSRRRRKMTRTRMWCDALVARPEQPKGAKDEVAQGKDRQLEVGAPRLLVYA